MFDATTGIFAANKVMRELGESGSIGRTVTHKPSFVIPAEEDFVPDVTVLDMGFKWFSAEVPAKEELMSREVVFSKDGETYDGIYLDWNVLIEVDKSFAISNGVFTIMVAGELENALGTVPKVGMYYGKPVYTDLDKNLIGCKFSFRWETIHPIDPKYLPGGGVTLPYLKMSVYDIEQVDSTTVVNNAKSAELNNLAESRLPIVLELDASPTGGTVATFVLTCNYNPNSALTNYMEGSGMITLSGPQEAYDGRWRMDMTAPIQ